MKLLICTQKVDKNDDLLGFFHSWIIEFAKNCEQVTVVCLFEGEVDLPLNVKVLSLGREENNFQFPISNFKLFEKLKYFFRFYRYIWYERKNYDSVFVHMNPIYVLLGGVFWRLFGKRVGIWYAHGHVPWELRIAEKMVDHIFTSTVSGCRLDSEKIRVVGQGIDVEKFQISNFKFQINSKLKIPACRRARQNSKLNLITVGRISPVKDLETLIRVVELLVEKSIDVKLDIIGAIGLAEQKAYYDSLLVLIKEKKLEERINFVGSVPNTKIAQHLQTADIFVSASRTGSLDKTFLEACVCDLPVIGCNIALDAVLGKYQERLFYPAGDYLELSKRIEGVIGLSDEEYLKMTGDLRDVVAREHGLENFVKKIVKLLS